MRTVNNIKMSQRSDTAASWAAADPLLLCGELGFESDSGRLKAGNGTARWNALAYLGGGVQRVNGVPPNEQGDVTIEPASLAGVVCSGAVSSILVCTQAEYTALENKDEAALYLIGG